MSSWQSKVIEVAEGLGFTAKNEDAYWIFSQGSPEGQDFNIEVDADDIEQLATELRERYENYDCSEEAYIWLDNTGHGKNGAPYDMKDVYEDMKWCENKIDKLAMEVWYLIAGVVNYKECDAVMGFNTKQWWVYSNDHDVYIDPPSKVLDELHGYKYPDKQEDRLNEIIQTDPEWLQDVDYWVDGETDI